MALRPPTRLAAGVTLELTLEIRNEGDTLWMAGGRARFGTVMTGVKILDAQGTVVREVHGEPPLPHSVAPGETVRLKVRNAAPQQVGEYLFKVDLVNQHICWFEDVGSQPFTFEFEVEDRST